ncbi:MAG: hypothetical protein JW736_04670 [Deltaproteobacteria bacterium]|nr:hypothetical protein [Deltaproteobacteria bacterium]MBN2688181.1 hypothetical protein [Deltaproteobacteria bacterium]
MKEINQGIIEQIPGEPLRRWFVSDFFDLLVWENDVGEIVGFQMCYDKLHNQHALTWNKDKGYLHNKVDDGENKPGRYKSAPILIADGVFDILPIADRFKRESIDIDAKVSAFVCEKIENYC